MSGIMGFWIAKRMRENGVDQPFERKRPKMPSTAWRASAAICFAIGATVAWLLFRDSSVVVLRMLAGGLVVFVIGMYAIETVWERGQQRAPTPTPTSPIGKRR